MKIDKKTALDLSIKRMDDDLLRALTELNLIIQKNCKHDEIRPGFCSSKCPLCNKPEIETNYDRKYWDRGTF